MKAAAVGLVFVTLTFVSIATAAPKPKPWQWTPVKAATRLYAANPFEFLDVSQVGVEECKGRGRGVAGRYSAFRCQIEFGYTATVMIRVLPFGSGRLCVVATADGKAQPHTPGTQGIQVVPGRSCPLR